MPTEPVVHDQKRWAMAAMERRLAVAKTQLLQQQQKNEKDKKGTTDVETSSKEHHQVESLPNPSKTLIRKDPKDDDYVAYTKFSHPIDENLLATNVEFSSGKGIVDNVLHKLLQSGDSAQKYLQGTKSVKLDNYILLDNFVQSRSSAAGSKKASQKNSKRSRNRMSMKRLKKSGALHLPEDFQKFDLFKPMHGMWESYMKQLLKVTGKIQLPSTLLSADLHGAFMFVAECKIESLTGVQGIMMRETSETFGIITREDKLKGSSLEAEFAPPSTASSVKPSDTKSTVPSASTKETNDDTVAVKDKESSEPSNLCDSTTNQPSSVDRTNSTVEHRVTKTPSHVQAKKEPMHPAASRLNDNTSSVQSSTNRKRKQETVINKADSGSGGRERDIEIVKSVRTKETVKPKEEVEDEKV